VELINREDRGKAEEDFMDFCTKGSAILTTEQARWLWNYLEQYSPKYAWNQPVAPTNGW
jgi:hypothetical protein